MAGVTVAVLQGRGLRLREGKWDFARGHTDSLRAEFENLVF